MVFYYEILTMTIIMKVLKSIERAEMNTNLRIILVVMSALCSACGGGGGSASGSGTLGTVSTPANFTMPAAIATVPPQN